MAKIVGHTLLAKLGKKRLRPGGVKATKWLLKQTNFNNKEVLEVASNMATTAISLARKYQVNITAVDLDQKALETAARNIKKHKVDNKIKLIQADATNLLLDNESFDIVLNEAMLTMLQNKNKEKAVSEYYRVLKKDGLLLTHDVCLLTDDPNIQKEIIMELTRAINFSVQPKTINDWVSLFKQSGFREVTYLTGPMSLLTPCGMVRDEGVINTLRIIKNALKHENREQFNAMRRTFKKYRKYLGFIAVKSVK